MIASLSWRLVKYLISFAEVLSHFYSTIITGSSNKYYVNGRIMCFYDIADYSQADINHEIFNLVYAHWCFLAKQ